MTCIHTSIAPATAAGPGSGSPVDCLTTLPPAPAVRVRRSTNTDTPIPPDEPSGENPPTGALIDYFLARSASVTLDILDSTGATVRHFSSTDPPEEVENDKELIPPVWIRPR